MDDGWRWMAKGGAGNFRENSPAKRKQLKGHKPTKWALQKLHHLLLQDILIKQMQLDFFLAFLKGIKESAGEDIEGIGKMFHKEKILVPLVIMLAGHVFYNGTTIKQQFKLIELLLLPYDCDVQSSQIWWELALWRAWNQDLQVSRQFFDEMFHPQSDHRKQALWLGIGAFLRYFSPLSQARWSLVFRFNFLVKQG